MLLLLLLLAVQRASADDAAASCGACDFFVNATTGSLSREPGEPAACFCPELYLPSRRIARIPDGIFVGLLNTTSVVLSHNDIGELGSGALRGLAALEQLQLAGNALTSLPEATLDPVRASLTRLIVANNHLGAMPAGMLPVVKEIDLSSNSITAVPSGLSDRFPRLEELSLAANSVSKLPASAFSNFSALAKLNVSANLITVLPRGIFQGSSSLTELDLSGNLISEVLPYTFAGLSSLELVYLHHNKIQALRNRAFSGINAGVQNRLRIYLSSNEISELSPDTFKDVGYLSLLDLAWNRIQTISKGVLSASTFANLEFLFLSANHIASLPEDVFESLAKCNTLLLGGNALSEVPAGLFNGMKRLRVLSLGNNNISQIHEGAFDAFAGTAREIILAKNRLRSLPRGLFKSMMVARPPQFPPHATTNTNMMSV